MASITKTENGYRAQVYVLGERASATRRTKREAEAWAAAKETEIRERLEKSPGDRVTLHEALSDYCDQVTPSKRGQRWERIRLEAFQRDESLPLDKAMAKIEPADIARFRDARQREVSAGSILRELGLLSAVFEHARLEWKYVTTNPVRDIRKPRAPDHRDVVITRPQIKAILREAGYRPSREAVRTVSEAVAIVFLVALRTGMRAGELCGLTWDRVYAGYCSTPHKVGRTETSLRDVPLPPKAERLINRMRGFDPKLVFGIKTSSLDAMFRKFRDRAGLSGFTFHDSRHTAATWIAGRMKSNDIPAQQALMDLCKIFGWTKLDQALTYYNPSAADIAKRIA